MLKTYLYLPDHLSKKIELASKTQKKSKAEVIRSALEIGIGIAQDDRTKSAKALLRIAALGAKYKLQGPVDSSTNIDKYLWGKDWSNEK